MKNRGEEQFYSICNEEGIFSSLSDLFKIKKDEILTILLDEISPNNKKKL